MMKLNPIFAMVTVACGPLVTLATIFSLGAPNHERPYEAHFPNQELQSKCPSHSRTREQDRSCRFAVRKKQLEFFNHVQKAGCQTSPSEATLLSLKVIHDDAVKCAKASADDREIMQELVRAANNNMHHLKL